MTTLKKPLLSIVIPAYNEAECIEKTIRDLYEMVQTRHIPYEFVIVNDHSTDATVQVVERMKKNIAKLKIVCSSLRKGFGNAIKYGIAHAIGEYVVFVMADGSETPEDIFLLYRTACTTHADCVFGNRFMRGSHVRNYPSKKLFWNRLGNFFLRMLLHVSYGDMTNACKLYRRKTLQRFFPVLSSSFAISLELALDAVYGHVSIVEVAIGWEERKHGQSKFIVKNLLTSYVHEIGCFMWKRFMQKKNTSYVGYLVTGGAFIFFAIRMFQFIIRDTYVLPYWDHLHYAQIFLEHMSFKEIFLMTQNEHHIGTGALLNTVLIWISHWNTLYETCCIGALLVVSAVLALVVKKRITGHIDALDAVIPLIFFNLYQSENLVWGFQIAFVLPLFFLYAVSYLRLLQTSWKRDMLLFICTVGSVYASFHGLIVGVLVYSSFLYDFLKSKTVSGKIRYGICMLIIALICCSYGWTAPTFFEFNADASFIRSLSFSTILQSFRAWTNVLVGLPQQPVFFVVIPTILLMIVLGVGFTLKKDTQRNSALFSLWFSLIYSLGFFVLILFGRGVTGSVDSMASRYVTHAIPLYFFLYVGMRLLLARFSWSRPIGYAAILVFMVISFRNDVDTGQNGISEDVKMWKACYLANENIEVCDTQTNFVIDHTFIMHSGKEIMQLLKQRKWNLYHQ